MDKSYKEIDNYYKENDPNYYLYRQPYNPKPKRVQKKGYEQDIIFIAIGVFVILTILALCGC